MKWKWKKCWKKWKWKNSRGTKEKQEKKLRAGHFITICYSSRHCQESTFNRMSQNGCQVKVRERKKEAVMNDGKSFSFGFFFLLMPIQLTRSSCSSIIMIKAVLMSPEAIEMWIGCWHFWFHLPIYFSNGTNHRVDEQDKNFMFSTSTWIHNFYRQIGAWNVMWHVIVIILLREAYTI